MYYQIEKCFDSFTDDPAYGTDYVTLDGVFYGIQDLMVLAQELSMV